MSVVKAMRAYQEEKLNCAQSVLRGFQERYAIQEEQITAAKQLGGGKAENGLCGALYAASLLADDTLKKKLNEHFIVEAGSDKCREIRACGKLSCGECVELAARVLHDRQ